jgi:FlaA1/EpsC-like NDP-sugar epimerase
VAVRSGNVPGSNGSVIKIQFAGMRPGEKLYEELSTLLEDTAPTAHEKIRIYAGNGMPNGDIEMWLLCLREACETRDAGRRVVAWCPMNNWTDRRRKSRTRGSGADQGVRPTKTPDTCPANSWTVHWP